MRPLEPINDRRLGVFAPSGPVPLDRFEAGCEVLTRLGFTLQIHPQTYLRDGYLAGSDAARLAAFWDLAEDPEVGAIIAARGGYGAHRWVDQLDLNRLARTRATLVGFSDVCALHAAYQRAGLESVHGPVVTQLADLGPKDHAHLATLLRSPQTGFTLSSEGPALSPGRCEGPLVGGCLAVLTPLVGSPLLYVPDGAILLLEDVGELTYRVDRALTHLHLAGVLQRVAGVALGDFVGCEAARPHEPDIMDVLRERLFGLGVPVLAGLPFGHGAQNRALTLGRRAMLDTETRRLDVSAST